MYISLSRCKCVRNPNMGKAMVNATNLIAHVTIVAHLNPKTNNDKSCMPWANSCICNKSNSCCVTMWHTINGMMKTLNPNPNSVTM